MKVKAFVTHVDTHQHFVMLQLTGFDPWPINCCCPWPSPLLRLTTRGNMIPTRVVLAGLVVLQLSAGLDAFYMCPFHKPSTLSCRRIDVPLVRARPQSPPAASHSSRGGRTHGSALRMVEDTALDIAVADLEDREFQVPRWFASPNTL